MEGKNNPAISISRLSKSFGNVRAVDGISLEIQEGEIFALLGPNGAGKTTTISMLCGLLAPTSGTANVAGHDVKKEPLRVRQAIGVVFQSPSSDDLLSGMENLEMHALLYGMPKEGREARILEMLRLVGLAGRANDNIKKYSGGMRKRLELVRALLHKPHILFLDEPTVGLDPQTRQHMWEYIRKMSKREGTTVVFTTHYLEEAEQFADRLAIIDHGKVIAVGKPRALVEQLGGDTVFLKAKEPDAVAKMLRKMEFVSGIKRVDGRIRLTLAHSHKNLPAMLRALPGIDGVEIRQASLNDVCIKYRGREIRKEEGEGSYWERMMNNKD